MFVLIERYINNMSIHDLNNLAISKGIGLSKDELEFSYNYIKKNLPDKVTDVSIAWIQAGHSLKKEPAGEIVKVKDLDGYLAEHKAQMNIKYGAADPSHRYFLLTSGDKRFIFGYDSQVHHPEPAFMAEMPMNCRRF